MKTIDCRGLVCPQPVVNTKKNLDTMHEGSLITIVDNKIAKENVSTLVRNAGYPFSVTQKGNDYYITITKIPAEQDKVETYTSLPPQLQEISEDVVYCLGSNTLGEGSPELGLTLIKSFFTTLVSIDPPKALIFLNSGIYLSCEGSVVLEQLLELQAKGVQIFSCGTCLNYYKQTEKLTVGKISNMLEIVTWLNGPHKTIFIS